MIVSYTYHHTNARVCARKRGPILDPFMEEGLHIRISPLLTSLATLPDFLQNLERIMFLLPVPILENKGDNPERRKKEPKVSSFSFEQYILLHLFNEDIIDDRANDPKDTHRYKQPIVPFHSFLLSCKGTIPSTVDGRGA